MAKHRFQKKPRPEQSRTPRDRTAHFRAKELHDPDGAFDPCPEHQADGAPCSTPVETCDRCGHGRPIDPDRRDDRAD